MYEPRDDTWKHTSRTCARWDAILGPGTAACTGTNKEADEIAKRASKRQPQETDVFEERLFKPSAAPPAAEPAPPHEELPPPPASGAPARGSTSGARPLLALEPQEGCWTREFKAYLLQGTLPKKEEDADRIARHATTYCIRDGELYRK